MFTSVMITVWCSLAEERNFESMEEDSKPPSKKYEDYFNTSELEINIVAYCQDFNIIIIFLSSHSLLPEFDLISLKV